MKKIKLVCFDVGGTLIYHKNNWRYYGITKLKEYGVKRTVNFLRERAIYFDAQIHKNLDMAIKVFAKTIGVKENKERFVERLKEGMKVDHQHIFFYKDTKRVLKELRKKKYKIALITNWHQHARDHFGELGLSKYADFMMISAEHGKRKPHPSLFKKVLKRFKVKPSEALMVGDRLKQDYKSAKRLGMHALLVERKTKTKGHAIRNLTQVLTYVERINRV